MKNYISNYWKLFSKKFEFSERIRLLPKINNCNRYRNLFTTTRFFTVWSFFLFSLFFVVINLIQSQHQQNTESYSFVNNIFINPLSMTIRYQFLTMNIWSWKTKFDWWKFKSADMYNNSWKSVWALFVDSKSGALTVPSRCLSNIHQVILYIPRSIKKIIEKFYKVWFIWLWMYQVHEWWSFSFHYLNSKDLSSTSN